MMALASLGGSSNNNDIFSWIRNLPGAPPPNNKLSICSSSSSSSSSSLIFLSVNNIQTSSSSTVVSFSITAEIGVTVSLWTSKPLTTTKTTTNNLLLLDENAVSNLFTNLIEVVLSYGGTANNSFSTLSRLIPKQQQQHDYYLQIKKDDDDDNNFRDMFNLAFHTLAFLVCTYEAPMEVRSKCLNTIIKNNLSDTRSRHATKSLMKLLGSNLEEQWMRCINLAITNWIHEQKKNLTACWIKTPSPLFSYAVSSLGLWKVHLYCPVIAMDTVASSAPDHDHHRLLFSLNYHQIEGVIQFNYKLLFHQDSIDVILNIDNVRCDVIGLVNEMLMKEQGEGAAEKHFPSRISLRLTPILQTHILSVSVGRSSENPTREIGHEKALEAGFDPPNPYMGIKVSAAETSTVTLKPWKFEQSVNGYGANFNWFLHDSGDGREVVSSKPSLFSVLNPKSWFRDRYSSAYRPFTRQGGIVFAGDEYGDGVKWKVDKRAALQQLQVMEWEIRGWIWLTYWPNKHTSFYNETRRLQFKEILHLPITSSS